jgi:hypothetical protein
VAPAVACTTTNSSSGTSSSSSAAQRLKGIPTTPKGFFDAVGVLIYALTNHDDTCKGVNGDPYCTCALVPKLIYYLELQARDRSFVTAMSGFGVPLSLIRLSALLLEGGHSARAFRRVTEAADW